MSGFDSGQGKGIFCLLRRVQTSSGAHTLPVQCVLGALSSVVQRVGHEHSLSCDVEVKLCGNIPPLPHTSFSIGA
jgi:hypothetical protein